MFGFTGKLRKPCQYIQHNRDLNSHGHYVARSNLNCLLVAKSDRDYATKRCEGNIVKWTSEVSASWLSTEQSLGGSGVPLFCCMRSCQKPFLAMLLSAHMDVLTSEAVQCTMLCYGNVI